MIDGSTGRRRRWTTEVVLVWRGEDDDRNDDLVYTVLVGTDANALQAVAIDILITFHQLSGLIEGQDYYWRIEVTDGMETIVSEQFTFFIEAAGDGGGGGDDDEFIPGFDLVVVSLALLVTCLGVSQGRKQEQ
jgi:hypothetical protein